MKKFVFLLFILSFNVSFFSQIKGRVLLEPEPLPGVELKFIDSEDFSTSDFDGLFLLPISKEGRTKNILITYLGLTIEIENVFLKNSEIKIKDFHLPYFQSISIEQYENLSKFEQKNCFPIRHWKQLLGYYNCNNLENDYLKLNCESKIKEFEYDFKTKTVKLNWDLINKCL